MKYIDGSSNSVSLDSIKKPELTQQLSGGNGGLWKYGSGPPRLDGIIALHFRDYKTEYQKAFNYKKREDGKIYISRTIYRP